MNTSAVVNRPVRTGIQGGAAYAVVEGLNAFHVFNMDERQYGISIVLLTALFSWLQVVIENKVDKSWFRATDD